MYYCILYFVIGLVVSLSMLYRRWNSGEDITVFELSWFILITCLWPGVFGYFLLEHGDIVIIKNKEKK